MNEADQDRVSNKGHAPLLAATTNFLNFREMMGVPFRRFPLALLRTIYGVLPRVFDYMS